MDTTTAIRRIHLHCAYVDAPEEETAEVIRGLLDQLDEREGHGLIRHAYWRMPEVSTHALRWAVGGEDLLRRMAGRGPVIGSCICCGRVVRTSSRDDAEPEGPQRCAACLAMPTTAVPTSESPTSERPTSERPTSERPTIAGTSTLRLVAVPEWEFERPPQPWPVADVPAAAVGRSRAWAEDYPDAEDLLGGSSHRATRGGCG